ncbi:MAG: PIN domain-containing protein [Oscillospiraceae bacterium]|nr:PIN domain-containing protein [Oscillospiraceae bacterium]
MLDYLGANRGFAEDAEKVFELAARRKDIKLVSSSAITDILYVLRRAVKDRKLVRRKYESFRKRISILSVTEKDIDRAFARDWKDFEDAVQYTVAESNGVDCIITRNQGDFEEKTIPSYSPQEFLERFQ